MNLSCSACSDTATGGQVDGPNEWLCVRCGGALTPVVDNLGTWARAVTNIPGVGRYGALLAAGNAEDLVSVDAALRPVESPQLAQALGVASLRLLPQTRNTTGTFKDNEGVLLAAKCREWGLDYVCMHSSGNTARAYQFYMDRAGIVCAAFVPQASAYKCPTTLLGKSFVVAVPGAMIAAADAAIAHSEGEGAFRLTPSQWKIEGKVPLGLALAEHCPDATVISVTVASGYGPLGVERGIRRARAAGLSSVGRHSFRLFQAADANLLGEAIDNGAESIDLDRMLPPERAFEPTLQSTNPNKTLGMIRGLMGATGSTIDSVSPAAVAEEAEAFTEVCAKLDVPLDYTTEKSAYICWAGLRQAARTGALRPSDKVVMIVSGSAPHERLP